MIELLEVYDRSGTQGCIRQMQESERYALELRTRKRGQRRRRIDRNIAVLFVVDMSGSTKGWINDVERESLVLCITIADEAQDYLPHMFGSSAYTLVEQIAKLPLRVSDIYRRIRV